MKYAIIIPDGCADEPMEALGGRTPLQAANVPAMDEITRSHASRGNASEAAPRPESPQTMT